MWSLSRGQKRAEYGAGLINQLAADLRLRHGKGFSRSNFIYMRLFYLRYPIGQTPSDLLSWSHYVELLMLDDPLERGFYEQQAIAERWSVAELKRQKAAALFLRLADASKDKAGILQLARQGQSLLTQAQDLLREPYVFEFLKVPESGRSRNAVGTRAEPAFAAVLLELGKVLPFVGRQYRITRWAIRIIGWIWFFTIAFCCFVLIDLKLGNVQHHDIGQMNLYLGYFAKEENTAEDQPPASS